MKTLKEQLDELRGKFIERIEKGEFETIKVESTISFGYVGYALINIDGCEFYFAVANEGAFVSDHSKWIKLDAEGWELSDKALSVLYNVVLDNKRRVLEEKKKKIEAEINELSR